MFTSMTSNIRGKCQRPNAVSTFLPCAWLIPLGVWTVTLCWSRANDDSRICDKWYSTSGPWWTAWCQLDCSYSHWGALCLSGSSAVSSSHTFQFDSILADYLHKRKFPIIGPATTWTLRTATVATLVGIYQFNTNDIGRQYSINWLFRLLTI